MQENRRWKVIALLAAGMSIGVVMVGTPAGAHVGGSVNHLWNHLKPKADARYVKKDAIRTIQGQWAGGGQAISTGSDGWDNISFGFQLASAPTTHFIAEGAASPPQCPGTVSNPKARAGHLCVYEDDSVNRSSVIPFNTSGALNTASRWGAGLWIIPAAAGDFWAYGTWAVKAPAGTTPSRTAPAAPAGPTAGG